MPHHTLSLWNHYQVRPRLGAAVGVLFRTDMFATIDDTVTLPGYTRVDVAAFYALTKDVRLQANVENAFDQKYWTNADSNTNISPGFPRTAPGGAHRGVLSAQGVAAGRGRAFAPRGRLSYFSKSRVWRVSSRLEPARDVDRFDAGAELQRVAVGHEQVRALAHVDRAQHVGHAQHLGRGEGDRAQGLLAGEAEADGLGGEVGKVAGIRGGVRAAAVADAVAHARGLELGRARRTTRRRARRGGTAGREGPR